MGTKGSLFVISGPSGVGTGTILREIIERNRSVSVSVSATTRAPRLEDKEGVTYFFKTEDEFKKMIDDGKFLEWAVYNGNYYGTPADEVDKKLQSGIDIILEIEVQGALKVMEKRPDAISVFIAPPDVETLYERLKGRGSETEEQIEKRVKAAEWELSQKDKYKHVVVNDDLKEAVLAIENIINNEKRKI